MDDNMKKLLKQLDFEETLTDCGTTLAYFKKFDMRNTPETKEKYIYRNVMLWVEYTHYETNPSVVLQIDDTDVYLEHITTTEQFKLFYNLLIGNLNE